MRQLPFFILILLPFTGISQIDPASVTIARDSFGVPHIFSPTDAATAYGLAWAHAEDDFTDIQYVLLPAKGLLGKAIGKKGAEADYVAKLFRCREMVDQQFGLLSPGFLRVVEGYVQGLNDYAQTHPAEVLVKRAFPVTSRDYLTAVSFSLCIISGVDRTLQTVLSGKTDTLPGFDVQGSNAFAIHPSRTITGEAFLAINSHQPLEGPVAWYEAHLQSDEGLNIIGGLFPGSLCPDHGVNENLGWAHTVNNIDKIDVYQLKMQSREKNRYEFDGSWIPLETRKIKLKVKGIPVSINKRVYWSRYGATVKTKNGVFSIRLTANMDIRAMEQWWRMNKARNFSAFYEAISMQALPMFNIVYADRYDTIFYISGGKMPKRNKLPKYNWLSTLPGNLSQTCWTEFHPIGDLPQYINPSSGYLFNTNHSPFLASGNADNLDPGKYDSTSHYENYNNNRSERFSELIKRYNPISYEEFLSIKYDNCLPAMLRYPYDVDTLFLLEPTAHPGYSDLIQTLKDWDKSSDTGSRGAVVFLLAYKFIYENRSKFQNNILSTGESLEILQYIRDYLILNFNSTDIGLGKLQKHIRGDKMEPIWGLPDVITAIYTQNYKNGILKAIAGESYIELVRFPKGQLPVIESVNCYGASAHRNSPHYNDQMDLFVAQKRKKMTLVKEEVLSNAESVYHPSDRF